MKKIVIIVAAIVGIYIVLGLAAPKEESVEYSIVIDKPIDDVFDYFVSLEKMEEWSPWASKGYKTVHEYINDDRKEGSIHQWVSEDKDRGKGEHITKEIVKNKLITSELSFTEPIEITMLEYLKFSKEDDEKTKVYLGITSHYGFNQSIKVMFFGAHKIIKNDIEIALTKAKESIE